ncbi:ABC transporter ATP-binding protein [Candidatus Formimonas warabiya]|uniref:ABC transporter n=1 Tax=Formimonas warabiya TaxID=1761012 RepID=A0A3G1KMB3_FORW1|nr:ABC transporter ATP-binding protein [Candidatus Formimonas warabiya]ATW23559.1 ABC transporter [Candidatus Formimonas warabiya]
MLNISNLSKTYLPEKKEALKNIHLQIQKGEFTALLGQNGAGKTTLINILAGNVLKTAGMVTIGGYNLDTHALETKRIIGIVPQETGYDSTFPVYETLKKQSGYFGMRHNGATIDELLEALYLTEKRNSNIRELSGGMKKRFLIAKALVHRPKILVLDEPTAGVDIEMRHTLYDFLLRLHQEGTTIILTTHYIEEAEKLCDRVVIIDSGRIIADEPKTQLMENFSREVTVEFQFDFELELADMAFLNMYHPQIEEKTRLQLRVPKKDLPKVVHMIAQKNMAFVDLGIEKPKLEDIYLSLIHR